MSVAEVDALLYLPGHPRQQLLRALRIEALSPGWQAPFRALLDGKSGAGNAGLAVTSPPPAWPGFRRRRLLPHRRQAGTRRHRQRLSPHPAGGRRPGRRGGAARHVHPRRDARAGAADQRRHRRNAGPRHAPRTGGGAFRPGDLVAARCAQSTRPLVRHRGGHTPCRAPERPHPCLLQPSRSGRPRRPSHPVTARRPRPTARCRGIPLGTGTSRWSCRTGVCDTCETTLIAGSVDYDPDPVEPPADGSALICCSRPHDDVVLDL